MRKDVKLPNDPTFVTMYFDLAEYEGIERKTQKTYMTDAEYLLKQNINLVVFIESKNAKQVFDYRNNLGLNSKTKIYQLHIKDLPYYYLLEQIKEARKINPLTNGSPMKDTPIYTALIWSKLALMKTIVELNPFASERFAWIDFGISYVAITQLNNSNTVSNTIHQNENVIQNNTIEQNTKNVVDLSLLMIPEKIKLLSLRPVFPDDNIGNEKDYYSVERGLVAFGLVTGSNQAWRLFYTLFDKEVQRLLTLDLAPSEQQIVPVLRLQNPNLFETFYGDYNGILINYNHFTRSIENVLRYTLILAREKGMPHISFPVGKIIFEELVNGMYDETLENDRYLTLILLNELFFAAVETQNYKTADDIQLYYSVLKQHPSYEFLFSKLPYQFIFDS